MEFDDKIVLVTGAAQGIGAAVAENFSRAGARVAMLDCQSNITACATQLSRLSGRIALGLPVDVSDAAVAATAVQTVEMEMGPIDILVNVA
ncbi:MAG: SDR family NAD(P)-dependent oxidoreductase, partial [Gammaproteobacteria bacterium]|nr:SDR family NAD(P)-dependent oxidoreductase [Gammaproteobacteria bacterium]